MIFRFRDCACPGTPHDGLEGRDDGDTVTFRARLPFSHGVEAARLIFAGEADASRAFPAYLHGGPEAWNLLDAQGRAVPLTEEAIDGLPFADQYEIADQGDTLYSGEVIAPFLRRMKKLSASGPTSGSSNRPSTSSRKRRSPLKPS